MSSSSRPLPLLILLVSSLVMSLTVVVVTPEMVGAETDEGPPSLDLADPSDGITDPMMNVDPIEMVCVDNQTDINRASVEELMAAFDLGEPVAQRLTENRPYLRVSDLEIVEGIGYSDFVTLEDGTVIEIEGKLVAILEAGNGCATPIELPPPVYDVCDGDGLDFNTATWKDIRKAMKIAAPIAQRIEEEAPYLRLSDLERVEGVEGPRLEEALEIGCLTPWPIVTVEGGPGWHWASPEGGGYLTDGHWMMAVQPGIVDEGTWMEVTPHPDSPDMIIGDYNIHGDWEGRIVLGIPAEDDLGNGWDEPIVFHEPNTLADAIWIDEALFQTNTGGLRFSTETLSEYGSTMSPFGPQSPGDSYLYKALIEPINGEYEFTAEDARNSLLLDAINDLAALNNPMEGCANTIRLTLDSSRDLSDVLTCSLDEASNTWTFRNLAGSTGPGGFFGYPVVVRATVNGQAEIDFVDAPVTSLISNAMLNEHYQTGQTDDVLSAAGTGWSLTLPNPDTEGGVTLSVDKTDTLASTLLAEVDNLTKVVPYVGGALGLGACNAVGVGVEGDDFPQEALKCAVTESGDILEERVAKLPDGTIASSKAAKAVKAFKAVAKFIVAVDATATVVQGFDFAGGWINVKHRLILPPPTGGGGGPGGGGYDGTLPSDRQNWKNAILQSGQRTYLIQDGQGGELFHIPTGGDYVCFAQSYPVIWENVVTSGPWIWYNVTNDTTCDGTHPQISIPVNATNWVIRLPSGVSYWMNENSEVLVIRDGGCFEQLAYNHFVLDFTPFEAIEHLNFVPGPVNSAC